MLVKPITILTKPIICLLLLSGAAGATWAKTVWMDMDQAALDAAYDQSVYAANLAQVVARFSSNSEAAREVLGPPQRLRCGDLESSLLDVYPTSKADAPIFVFIHGGAWKLGLATDNAFAAEAFVREGAHFVVPDFSNVQDFDGNLMPMHEQLVEALTWIYQNAEESFGGDPNRIYISGFSSGGHLASTLLYVDWPARGAELPANLIKGAVLCSGMYDLVPVALSARSNYVDFTPETIEALSAVRYVEKINCPVVLAYGTEETPEFQRQTRDFAEALERAGVEHSLYVGENYNHFEMIETLANPYGLLGRPALDLVRPDFEL